MLHALTAEELAFLAAPLAADEFAARLTPALAATLSARLRRPLALALQDPPPVAVRGATPCWQVDAGVATLWLSGRLGGRSASGDAPFVSATLLRTLDAVLAERWLDGPAELPAALAWRVDGEGGLGVVLPQTTGEMTRWAREVIDA